MIVGHNPEDDSLTKATTGGAQLSASSVTTFGFITGTSPRHWTLTGAGFEAVGGVISIVLVIV